jgi:predicted permease
MDPAQARAEALARLGDLAQMEASLTALGQGRDRTIERREWWDEFHQDVRFAWRQCRRQPGFTAAAVLTLAVGLGATTAIFSVVHAVILRPLPVADPDRLLFVTSPFRGQPGSLSVGNFHDLRQRAGSFEQLAAVQVASFNLAEGGEPERVPGLKTTASYFLTLGIQPEFGRAYTTDEDQPGRNAVVVLTHRLWQRRFGGDRSIVGKSVRVNGIAYQVIGIMSATFDDINWGNAELLTPIAFTPEQLTMHDNHYLDVFGRRRSDTSQERVVEELNRIGLQLEAEFPRDNTQRSFGARLLSDFLVANTRTRLFVLLAAVALVLVIACVNVANLLLARLAARSRELAIRAAIGAGRGRIIRQVLTECLVLAVAGGVAGVFFAWWAVPVLIAYAPAGIPRLETASIDTTVVTTALALVLLTALLVGLLPAWAATRRTRRPHLRDDLGEGKGTSSSSLKPRGRQMLIASQACLVLIVLSGAALLVRSAINLQQVPIGFDVAGVLSARISLPPAEYKTADEVTRAFSGILERVQESQQVSLAALDSQPPLMGGGSGNGLLPEGRPERIESMILGRSHFVSADYFTVLRIPVHEGRMFTPQDTRSAPLVMIISETLKRQAFGEQSALGKRIACCEGTPGNPSWKIVVGVVADVHAHGPATPPQPDFYLPTTQMRMEFWGWSQQTMNLVVRSTSGDPASLTTVIRGAVRAVDPTLPVYRITTMQDGLRQTMAHARFNTSLMSLLALTGLLLAALGIYSVIAWLVAQRTREIGVRMALGASARAVILDMTTHGLKPVAVGLAAGLGGALATGKLLEGQLFEVGARDPMTLGVVVTTMLAVAATAAIVPAWRASSIDPSQALHDG